MTEKPINPEVEPQDDEFEVGITRVDFKKKARSFSKVLDEIAPSGESTKLRDIAGQTIVIHSVRPFDGRFGKAAYVIFTDEGGAIYNTIINQKIVLGKLLAVVDQLPLEATIVQKEGGKFDHYYDIE
jgi:hypothetical protein